MGRKVMRDYAQLKSRKKAGTIETAAFRERKRHGPRAPWANPQCSEKSIFLRKWSVRGVALGPAEIRKWTKHQLVENGSALWAPKLSPKEVPNNMENV